MRRCISERNRSKGYDILKLNGSVDSMSMETFQR